MRMNDINPKKTYSVNEIVGLGVLGRTAATVSRKVLEDKAGANVLKSEVGGSPHARRYRVKGSNLIKYMEEENKKRS